MTDLFPPFAPDPLEPRRRRFKPVPFRVIAPNLVTVLALCLGLTAIRLAYEGHLDTAVICIIVAGVLDGLDGRLARFLKGTSRFGAELDSLSDFVCFGVAPALILYGFILQSLKGLGWVAALLFAIASALRLARFNVMIDDPTRPDWKKNFFVGMAAPAGAVTVLLPIYLHFVGVPSASVAKGKLTRSPMKAAVTTKIGSTQSRGTRLPMVLPEKVGTVDTIIKATNST